jgi:hypothetical protein
MLSILINSKAGNAQAATGVLLFENLTAVSNEAIVVVMLL